jgi:hypothetical protein
MAWFVWGCVILALLLIAASAIVLLTAALRVMQHLGRLGDAAPLREAAALEVGLRRLEAAGEALSVLAGRSAAARELLSDSLRRLRSPLFYFGRLP